MTSFLDYVRSMSKYDVRLINVPEKYNDKLIAAGFEKSDPWWTTRGVNRLTETNVVGLTLSDALDLYIQQDKMDYGRRANGQIILREKDFALSDLSEVYVGTKCPITIEWLEALGYVEEDDHVYTRNYKRTIKKVKKLEEMSIIERLVYLDRTWAWNKQKNPKNPFDDSSSD